MMRKLLAGFAIASVLAVAAPRVALAHHAMQAEFDQNNVVVISGVLKKVNWVNPHVNFLLDVTEPDGKVMKHRCEMRSAHVLRRSGWSPELFKSGDKVDITASPDRADVASCYLQTIVFANGSRMDRYGQYVKASTGEVKEVRGPIKQGNLNRTARRPSGEPNITGDWAPEQTVMANPRGVGGGMVRLSALPEQAPDVGQRQARAGGAGAPAAAAGRGRGAAGPRTYGGTELTERGEKEAAAFTQQDNPRFRCETTSIIFDWTFDGPVNRITQNRDTIVIEYGQMNLKRTVHMNLKQHPANVKLSRAGHSTGRWEGDTLVIDTVGYNDKFWFDSRGTPHTEKLHTIVRFSRPNFGTLINEFTIDDPGAYSRTVQLKFTARRVRQDVELMEDICTENNQAGIAGGYKLNSEQR